MITEIDKNSALVLIDLQKSIVDMQLAHPVSDVLQNAAKLVDAFHKAGRPVVLVNVNTGNAKWVQARKDARSPVRARQADWLEIAGEIKTQADDIFITKHTWGAFFETPLHQQLQQRGVTGIVLAGIATSIGVEGTARQASELGYNLTFATDAMTDMVEAAHQHSVAIIFPRIGEVGTTNDVMEKLNA